VVAGSGTRLIGTKIFKALTLHAFVDASIDLER
jgi:hypothetical protein